MSEDPVHISEPLLWTLAEMLDKQRKRTRKVRRKWSARVMELEQALRAQSIRVNAMADRLHKAEEVMAQVLQWDIEYADDGSSSEILRVNTKFRLDVVRALQQYSQDLREGR